MSILRRLAGLKRGGNLVEYENHFKLANQLSSGFFALLLVAILGLVWCTWNYRCLACQSLNQQKISTRIAEIAGRKLEKTEADEMGTQEIKGEKSRSPDCAAWQQKVKKLEKENALLRKDLKKKIDAMHIKSGKDTASGRNL